MGVIHGLDNQLYMDCLAWPDMAPGTHCVDPFKRHIVLHRDHEHAIYAAALLKDHGEAQAAAEKINEYLSNWADDEIYVIQIMEDHYDLEGLLRDLDTNIKENEEDVRLTQLQDEESTQGSSEGREAC